MNSTSENLTSVNLSEFADDNFLALLVAAPSGILYTNQCGGIACTHPYLEGALVPLNREDKNSHDPLENWWCSTPVSVAAEKIAKWLAAWDLDELFEPNAEFGGFWGEAWVPVRVKQNENPIFAGLSGRVGILTYTNSD